MRLTQEQLGIVPGLYVEERPWGNFLCFGQNVKCTAKVLRVHPWDSLSVQFHNHRDQVYFFHDTIRVVYSLDPVPEGLELGDPEEAVKRVRDWWRDGNQVVEYAYKNGIYLFRKRHIHSVVNETGHTIHITEVAFGDNDETDIFRVYDEYGRTHGEQSTECSS